jgi:hypothetical protein
MPWTLQSLPFERIVAVLRGVLLMGHAAFAPGMRFSFLTKRLFPMVG